MKQLRLAQFCSSDTLRSDAMTRLGFRLAFRNLDERLTVLTTNEEAQE